MPQAPAHLSPSSSAVTEPCHFPSSIAAPPSTVAAAPTSSPYPSQWGTYSIVRSDPNMNTNQGHAPLSARADSGPSVCLPAIPNTVPSIRGWNGRTSAPQPPSLPKLSSWTGAMPPAELARAQAPALERLLLPAPTQLRSDDMSVRTRAPTRLPSLSYDERPVLDAVGYAAASPIAALQNIIVHARKRQRTLSDAASEADCANAYRAYIKEQPIIGAGGDVSPLASRTQVAKPSEKEATVTGTLVKDSEDAKPGPADDVPHDEDQGGHDAPADAKKDEDGKTETAQVLSAKLQSHKVESGDADPEEHDDAEVVTLLTHKDHLDKAGCPTSPTKASKAVDKADTENDSSVLTSSLATPRRSPKKVASRERIQTRSVTHNMKLSPARWP